MLYIYKNRGYSSCLPRVIQDQIPHNSIRLNIKYRRLMEPDDLEQRCDVYVG